MRRLFKILVWLAGGLLLAAATLPWWLGGALALAKRPLGLTYARYERIGYARFALTDVRYRQEGVTVTAGRIEADTPLVWGWRHVRGGRSPLFVKHWRVEAKGTETRAPDPDAGWRVLRRELLAVMDAVALWLPEARAETGEVIFPGGRLGLARANWRGRSLEVEGLSWAGQSFQGAVEFVSRDDLIRLRLASENRTVRLELESRGPKVTGTAHWLEQPVSVSAEFGERGWLPAGAQAVAENWMLSGDKLGLEAVYGAVRGGGRFEWRRDGFVADLTAKGEPVPDKNIPPLELAAHGRGDLETLTVETLHATIPGLRAELSEPVRLNREGRLLSGPSRLVLEADLARQAWFSGEGRVTGEARIEAGRNFKPRVEVRLAAEKLKAGRWSLPQLKVAGVFDWPRVEIGSASVDMGADETVRLSGGINLETKEVRAAKIEARLNGATVAGWWPGAPVFASARVTAQAEGPWAKLRHGGDAEVEGLDLKPMHPLAVKFAWEGAGVALEKFAAEASNGGAQVSAGGATDAGGARIDMLRIQKGATTWLALEKPVRIDRLPVMRCEPLVLAGEAGSIELAGRSGTEGEARLLVKEFSTAWLRDWLVWRGPDWRIAAAEFSGRWNDGPMEFSLSAAADTALAEQRPVGFQVKASGGRGGVKLETLQVFEGRQEAMTARGTLPVVFTPGAVPRWAVDAKAKLDFTAETRPDAAFWTYLAETTGLAIERPQLNLELSGTWQEPQGKLALAVPRVATVPGRFKGKIPAAEAIDGLVEFDPAQITLRKFSALIEGQAVQAEGSLPVPKGGLGALPNMTWPQLVREATGRLRIPGAEIAALAPYISELVAPRGRLEADVTLAGGRADGHVRIENTGTRPVGPLGVLQDVRAELALAGRGLEIRSLTARMAGQTVTCKGSAELKDDGVPRFDLSLQGENLPFVRQVGLLLRGDLDLKLVSTDGGVGRISGKVRLRESLFSTDVRDLVPKGGGGAGAAARPPFFAVEAPPFNAWQLDVELGGERFLRLRTPVFNGVVSMRFRLANTLGEPRATGQAVIDEGQILLPFAAFAIQQGTVQLAEANPYEPALFVTGTSRRYGYDLRMEVTGTASAPVLVFSSSPPLDSEQVLLLVMAGQTPGNEISYTGNQRAARLGQYLGESLFNSVRGDSGGTNRLSISTGEKVSRQGRETYEVEYGMGGRWSLVGEYDEFDDYNAGVKWRVLRDKRKEAQPRAK